MFRDLVLRSRSYRRFREDEAMEEGTLRELVDLARCCPSAGNVQPLRYIITCSPDRNELVFQTLAWAGYLTDWDCPVEGERPAAYIVILGDTETGRNFGADQGIAAQTVLLGATEKGYGGCMFGAIDRNLLRENLKIPERYEVLLVVALGRPVEQVVLEDVGEDGSIKYYRDENAIHHVPKRKLDDIILEF